YEHQGKQVHLLDTPGKPDFIGAALEGLSAVETAAAVVSAPAGIEVNTRRLFNEAGRRGLARMLVVNKMDGDNIRFPELAAALRASFGKACVFFNAPVGHGGGFKGVVSVLNPPASPLAACLVDLADARSKLIDAVVEADEELMMKYLDSGS